MCSPEQPRAELRLGRTPHGPGAARSGREHPKRVRGAVQDPGLLNGEGGKRGARRPLSCRGAFPSRSGTTRARCGPRSRARGRRRGRRRVRPPRLPLTRPGSARRHTCPDRGARSCFPRRPRGGLRPPRERLRSRDSRGRPRSTPRSRARRRGSRRSRREARADPRSRSRPGRQAPGMRSPRRPGATHRRRARTRAPASRLRRLGSRCTRPLRWRRCASRPRAGGSSRRRSRAVP